MKKEIERKEIKTQNKKLNQLCGNSIEVKLETINFNEYLKNIKL